MSGGPSFGRRITRGFSAPIVAALKPRSNKTSSDNEGGYNNNTTTASQASTKHPSQQTTQQSDSSEGQAPTKKTDEFGLVIRPSPARWWFGSSAASSCRRVNSTYDSSPCSANVIASGSSTSSTGGDANMVVVTHTLTYWKGEWGAYCRRTGARENQDAWFSLITKGEDPSLKIYNGLCTYGAWLDNSSDRSMTRSNAFGFNESVPDDSMGHNLLTTNKIKKRGPREPIAFGVLDGHGTGGRVASHVGSKILSKVLGEGFDKLNEKLWAFEDKVNPPGKYEMKYRLQYMNNTIIKAFNSAHQEILARNAEHQRDYGTTAVVTVCIGRFIMTATCGDSSSHLIAVGPVSNNSKNRLIINVKLSCDHSLFNNQELKRIAASNSGKVVRGEGGVSRLIPKHLSYENAKNQGLSINMARALGHCTLSQCALLPDPQCSLVDLYDIYSTLARIPIRYDQEFDQRHFDAKSFMTVLEQKFGNCNKSPSRPSPSSRKVPRPPIKEPYSAPHWRGATTSTTGGANRSAGLITTTNPPTHLNPTDMSHHIWESPIYDSEDETTTSPPHIYIKEDVPIDIDQSIIQKNIDLYLVLLSDGITDVMSRSEVSAYIVQLQENGHTIQETANCLTRRAEDIRKQKHYRADNCTAVIVKLEPPTTI